MYTSEYFLRKCASALIFPLAVVSAMLTSCITDEGIPYPDIQANFATFDVRYQERPASIDTIRRQVTVYLNDSADLKAVDVTSFSFTRSDASLVDPEALSKPINLEDSFHVALKVYREYMWTIRAVQHVEYEFSVEYQIGASVIDETAHTVKAIVPTSCPLSSITVRNIKLGGATAVLTPDIEGRTVDFTDPVTVSVQEHGQTTEWTIIIEQSELNIDISAIDAWTGVVWVYIAAAEDENITVSYRQAGMPDAEWLTVNPADITSAGSVFTARINGLNPLTEYEVFVSTSDESTVPVKLTTGSAPQLPNTDFTEWWLDDKVWCPWVKGEESFWETGNKGAATLGKSNVVPIEDTKSPTGYAGVLLQTRFVGVSVLGKLAAGSIFSGRFVGTDGTNGILSFGRPFTEFPTKIRVRLKYESSPIDYTNSEFKDIKGQPDTCIVWCALCDRDEPYEIRTNPKNRQLFDPQDPSVVAYGEFTSGSDIPDYITVDIPLVYRSTSRRPHQIILVASASKLGDYFTGGSKSVMSVTGYELLYDY